MVKDDSRVKLLGYIPDSELVDFYSQIDTLVFPTAAEGYGLPIVEAMACKKPVIVLSDAIIPKEVKYKCIIVDNLEGIFRDQYFFEELITCYGNVEENYAFAKLHDWDDCIKNYIKVYEKVLSC